MAAAEHVYHYLVPSAVRAQGGQTDLMLATPCGNVEDQPADHPRFFDGFLEQPEQTAVGLLGCALGRPDSSTNMLCLSVPTAQFSTWLPWIP